MTNVEKQILDLQHAHKEMVSRLNHLDECVDGLKLQIDRWDKRMWIAFGMICGVLIGSGLSVIKLFQIGAEIAKLPMP